MGEIRGSSEPLLSDYTDYADLFMYTDFADDQRNQFLKISAISVSYNMLSSPYEHLPRHVAVA